MGETKKTPPPPDEPEKTEIFSDMDAYQEKLAADWEAAKSSYQTKINDIMEAFIKEKGLDDENNLSVLLPEEPKKKSDPGKMENLMARAEKLLKAPGTKTTIPLWRSDRGVDFYESTSRARQFARRPSFWLVTLLAVGVASYAFFFRQPAPTPLPYSHTAGLVVAKDKLYIVDWLRKSLFIHRIGHGFPLISVENMPNDFLTGLAIAKDKVISLNSFSSQIFVHDTTPEHLVTEHHASPGTHATGLYFDGLDLWAVDDGDKTLIQFQAMDSSEVKETYHFQGVSATSFALENGRVWILSKKARTVHLFRLEDPLRLVTVYDLDPVLKGMTPTSIDIKNSDLWLTTENPATIQRVPIRLLKKSQN